MTTLYFHGEHRFVVHFYDELLLCTSRSIFLDDTYPGPLYTLEGPDHNFRHHDLVISTLTCFPHLGSRVCFKTHQPDSRPNIIMNW